MSDDTLTVLVPDEVGERELARVDGVRVVRYDEDAGVDGLPAEAAQAQVFVPGFLGADAARDLLDACPQVRLVQLLTAGAEKFVGALPDGVALSDCKGAHGGVTAEWVLAAILAVLREIPEFVRHQVAAHWDQHLTDTLTGKSVLLVGAGDLAEQTGRRLEPFDVGPVTLVGSRAREGVHGVDELPDLLPDHDITVLLVPLTDTTRGMVDAAFLAAMPDGALLVNAARGPVVDTDALLAELTSGRLRAAVDVTDPEPLPADHPLWRAPNLLITPHVGGSVPGHLERAYRIVVPQIEAVVAGEDPPNLVVGQY
ncbi:2-hydroxyacid dehydrogenase [Actinomycetospora sp. CA-084318]|uniref:2-hydroxyacid dehydrogenase n=1 Tax=Actinomycetospora sp. CA-084318 TaxID=3239892 RepID=UPI003D993A37